jgi:hypothetical protein
MAAFTTTPSEAGEGPSVIGIATAIGAKIRDAAENAKEEREKAQEAGETPKKGSLFKSALANQFNPIKSKKAKSNWAKQFSWNKPKDKPVTPPTEGDGANGSAKLKEFIAGGFTAILKDTGVMVAKLGGIGDGVSQNLSATTASSGTLTAIKETLDAQTDLRRKALEQAKYARAEKELEKTQDTSSTRSPMGESNKGGSSDGGEDGGGGPLDWIKNIFSLDTLFNALGVADIASNIPGKWLQKLNPFKKSPVTQGAGGKPPGPRMPGSGPRVTTSGGAPAARTGGNLLSRLMPKGLGGVATRFGIGRIAQGAMGLANPIGWGILGGQVLGEGGKLLAQRNRDEQERKTKELELSLGIRSPETSVMPSDGSIPQIVQRDVPWYEKLNPFNKMSDGGIVPLNRGGVVDNPTKTTLNPGDSVIPLNRNTGKQMLGNASDTSAGETAVDTVGAMILGVSSGMLGKTASGTAGDAVKQDIRKAAKEFGISNLTFTSSIGKGKFGVVDTNKSAKDFMSTLFDSMKISLGKGKGDKGGGGGGSNTPNAGDVAGQAEAMVGNSAQEAAEYMDKMDEKLTAAGIPDAIYGSDKVKGDVIDAAWCASYVAALLGDKGYKPPNNAMANAYAPGKWGDTINASEAKPGDVITFDYSGKKSSADHVAVVTGNDGKTITYVGGNQGSTGNSKTNKVTEGSISVNDATVLGITRPKEKLSTSSNPQAEDAKQTAQATKGLTAPSIASASEASLPDAQVTRLAQDGMVGGVPPQPAWWDIGGRINRWLDEQTYPERYNKQRAVGNNPYFKTGDAIRQMKEQGYAKGGTTNQAKMRQKMRTSEKAKRATNQRLNLGLVKGGNNSGYSVPKTGMRPGESPDQWAQRQSDAIKLADKLNKEQGLGKYKKPSPKPQAPKPRPAPPAAPAGGVGPAPTPSSGGAQAATVVTPPVSPSSSKSFSAGGFGGNVPQGRTMAATFADFLYTDLIE